MYSTVHHSTASSLFILFNSNLFSRMRHRPYPPPFPCQVLDFLFFLALASEVWSFSNIFFNSHLRYISRCCRHGNPDYVDCACMFSSHSFPLFLACPLDCRFILLAFFSSPSTLTIQSPVGLLYMFLHLPFARPNLSSDCCSSPYLNSV